MASTKLPLNVTRGIMSQQAANPTTDRPLNGPLPQKQQQRRNPAEVYKRMESLLVECKYLDCYQLGINNLGKNVTRWPGLVGQRFAISLANRLGGWQLGKVLAYRVMRVKPDSVEAKYYRFARAIDTQPMAQVWLDYRDQELDSPFARLQAAWLQLKCGIVASFRDFDTAHDLLNQAVKIQPESQIVQLNRVSLLTQEDRMDEALELCMKLQQSYPLSSVIASSLAAVLTQSNQIEDAIDVLETNLPMAQFGGVATQLASLYTQRKDYSRSVSLLRGVERYFPLADPLRRGTPKPGSVHADIAAERSEVLYHLGKLNLCIKEARRVRRPYYDRLADHLESFDGIANQKQLEIPFQRQDHMTCAPATLSMLSGYWQFDVDHDSIAGEICYEGTSAVDQRLWAEAKGFVAKEFRCTEETTKQLIDLDIPFALTTVEPDSAHIQVICGYDTQRGTMSIQDPSSWYVGQAQTKPFLESYEWCGPRALVLLPKEKEHLLAEVELPEIEQYDWLYHLEIALRAHNRSLAERMLEKLQAWDPNHRLTHWGAWLMAGHDGNAPQRLAALTSLCQQFPKSEALLVRMSEELIRLGKADSSIELLRRRIDEGEAGLTSHLQLICLLGDDCSDEIERLLHKVLLLAPTCEQGLLSEAARKEQAGDYEQGFELVRLASCAAPSSGNVMSRLLYASERFGKEQEVIDILKNRFEEYGHVSSDPGMMYARALTINLQHDEAVSVIRAALEKRPEDGNLLCDAAVQIGFLLGPEEGRKVLHHTETALPDINERITLAQLSGMEGQLEESLKLWHQAIELGADECSFVQQITELTSEVEGIPATIRYLQNLAERHPENSVVLSQAATWLIHVGELEQGLALLDCILNADSSHGWAWRERALVHMQWQQFEQALDDANNSLLCEQCVYSYQIRGDVLVALERFEEAKADYQAGLGLCVDSAHAIRRWVNICDSDDERLNVVRFIMKELATQNITGEGLRTFYDEARWILESAAMEQSLQFLRSRWPNMLQILNLYSEFLQDSNRNAEAIELLKSEEARFGMLAEYWSEYGVALIENNQLDESISAYREAFRLDANSVEIAQRLVYALQQAERVEESREVLERALSGNPSDPRLLLSLAKISENDEVLVQRASQAAFNAPRWDAPWEMLSEIDAGSGTTLVLETAAEIIRVNAREAAGYLRRAEGLVWEQDIQGAMQALEKAVELEPNYTSAYRLKASTLAGQGKLDEALDVCQPEGLPPNETLELHCFGAELLYAEDRKKEACHWLFDAIQDDTSVAQSWARLADIAEEIEEPEIFARAADILYEIAPESEVALGYRFAKFRMQENLQEAEDCLKQALALKPSYDYGVFNLFQLYAEGQRWPEAEKLIRESQEHVSPALSWEVSVAAAVGQRQADRCEQLLREAGADLESLGGIMRCNRRWNEDEKKLVLNMCQEELQLGRATSLMANTWSLLAMESYGPAQVFILLGKIKCSKAW
ncbi:MAG: tetratricopeptide repeat protein, partial [Planctomycetota bacterium]